MNDNKHTQSRIDAILGSTDGIKRAEANPYLFTRIMSKLGEEKSVWASISGFITRPAIVLSTLCLVIILNVFVVVNSKEDTTSTAAQNNNLNDNEYQQMASATAYDYVNVEP
jgi:hypothetical protein